MEHQQLSVEQIREQLQAIEQSKATLEKALVTKWQEAKTELAQQIRELIDERGYDVAEIIGLVTPRRRRGPGVAAAAKKGGRAYMRYVDPENPENVYVRGVLPGWMKQKMTEQGYDPSVKEDREAFKANYLRSVQD